MNVFDCLRPASSISLQLRLMVNRVSALLFCLLPLLVLGRATQAAVDFSRDIQPIFAGNCYECHGPQKQKGKLRLDTRDSALRESKDPIIVPGKAELSELYRRVTLPKGHEDIMPNRGEPLTRAQTDLIRDWINEGAIWPTNLSTAKHWAYVSPARPAAPAVKNNPWPKNELDR